MKFFPASLFLALGLCVASAAQAAITTFNFNATINFAAEPELSALYQVGGAVHGQFRLDDSVPNSANDETIGTYNNALLSTQMQYGNANISSLGGRVGIENTSYYDAIRLYSGPLFEAGGLSGPTLGDWRFTGMSFVLVDGYAQKLSSNVFPNAQQISNVSGFTHHTIVLTYQKEGLPAAFIEATIQNITPVPEPESYAMLLAGFGALAVLARRKKRLA